ncbi:M16 family metallopeptidase [Fodinibius salsisoli]|uniref:Insulinase family protein n=1 Tax=Fodinibius salsisoli TaxID=2820877 RepID=A0ABT3PRY3_9BACT|nr:pitrilysin family protein [Fodinibius salsisoli]MCW9708623.1 insulinase family protein [Fodinibius salsisoli]
MKRLSITCFLILFVASLTQAQKQYDELEFPELNNFQKPEVETFTTANGIKFFLVEDHELPLINASAIIRTGGVQVPNDKAGLASITGTVIRSGGTETYPADSLNTLLENKAASIETSIGFTSGSASMDVLKEDLDALLPVFVDVLTNPAFPEDKLDLAKTQQKSSISRRNDDTQGIGFREFQRLIYGKDSAYGRNTEYATVNNISREDLIAFHQNNFVAENMSVGVVGDFETAEMKQKLRTAFGEVPSGNETDLSFPDVNYEDQNTINFINKSDVNQSFVLLGHLGGMRDNPDYAKVQVMNRVLSGGFSGRLMQVVRTEMGLAYAVFGQYGMNSFYPGTFYTGVMTKSATTAEAIDAIIEQIERLQNEPITEKELQDTKDQILNSSVFEYDSYEKVLNQQMSYDYRGLPEDAFQQYLEGVRETTIEDVQHVAQKYLNPDQLQILVVGNKDEIGDQLQKYGSVNTVDISIPQPGSDNGETVKGDAEKGATLLNQMAEAVIEPGTDLNTLTLTGEVQQGGQTIGTTQTIDYPDAIEQTIEAPMGKVQLSYKGGSGTMKMGGQERPLPPQMAKGLKSTLNKSFLAIAMKADELDPQFLGTEEVEDTTYNKVSVKVEGTNVTLLLDQQTGYPQIQRFKQFNPQQGQQVSVENRNSNWTTTGGVAYPYSQVTYIDGNKSAEASYQSHTVNE